MRVDIHFYSGGPLFRCCECGYYLKDKGDGIITHPTSTGLIFKQIIGCQFVGKKFKRPFRGVQVEELH